jgi:nucleoside-diphosphate-sugar epimerase
LEEGIAAGIRAFVHVSSVKAVGERSEGRWTEETPARPADPYGISKLEAERMVRQISEAHGIHAPILRLPLVYGPGVKANVLRLFQAVDRGFPLPLAAVRNRRSLVAVQNVVAAIRAVLASPAIAAETFFVSDGEDLSTPELVVAVAAALNRPVRLFKVPPELLRGAGAVVEWISRVPSCPSGNVALDSLLESLSVDSGRIARVVGFRPSVSVQEGLAHTAAWYRTARSRPL